MNNGVDGESQKNMKTIMRMVMILRMMIVMVDDKERRSEEEDGDDDDDACVCVFHGMKQCPMVPWMRCEIQKRKQNIDTCIACMCACMRMDEDTCVHEKLKMMNHRWVSLGLMNTPSAFDASSFSSERSSSSSCCA